jgi:phosphopantothenoylcysteine decarboxylase/phosphopantothenate--cysteine ligase
MARSGDTEDMPLSGRRVVVGVCGSIAAYKACEVVRGLVKAGAEVRVVMTESATKFVGPATFAALSGYPVHTDLFAEPERVIHVELGRWADAYVVCGATASTLARLAQGSGEEIVSATYLMCRCPVVVAPAMHTEMWEHEAVQRNVAQVQADSAILVPPEEGDLASGDVGVGRLADPAIIVESVVAALSPHDLEGVRVLVTVGPTREAIDPVRFISNRSTGRMGFALAREAKRRGAHVTVVSGPASSAVPSGVDVVSVETADDMYRACLDRFEETDVCVLNAAVADWRPADVAPEKIKKADASKTLSLEPTADIAAELGRKKGSQLLVVFAAETHDLIENARQKLESKHADLVVANLVGLQGTGFESETNEASIVSPGGVETFERMSKDDLATRIWDRIARLRATR